jgi:hypothetical protein
MFSYLTKLHAAWHAAGCVMVAMLWMLTVALRSA